MDCRGYPLGNVRVKWCNLLQSWKWFYPWCGTSITAIFSQSLPNHSFSFQFSIGGVYEKEVHVSKVLPAGDRLLMTMGTVAYERPIIVGKTTITHKDGSVVKTEQQLVDTTVKRRQQWRLCLWSEIKGMWWWYISEPWTKRIFSQIFKKVFSICLSLEVLQYARHVLIINV